MMGLADECISQVVESVDCFNKIAIQARAQMAADKEAVGLSRVHMYESKCILHLGAIQLLRNAFFSLEIGTPS